MLSRTKRLDLPVSAYQRVADIQGGLTVGLFPHRQQWPLENHLRQLVRAPRDPLTLFATATYDYYDKRHSAVAYAVTASGITNLMHVATAAAAGTGQAVIMHADRRGLLPRPWLRVADAPVLDRAAINYSGTVSMLTHCLQIAHMRRRRCEGVLKAHKTCVLPLGDGKNRCEVCSTKHRPAIVLMIEPGWMPQTINESKQILPLMHELLQVGADMGVLLLIGIGHQRLNKVLPPEYRRVVDVLGLPHVAEDGLMYMFNSHPIAPLRQLGQTYARDKDSGIQAADLHWLDPYRILDVAAVTTSRQPAMPDDEAALGGQDYAQRWTAPDILGYLNSIRSTVREGECA